MGQVGHHYAALASAVTLTAAAVRRPENVELILDGLFKGWAHGRECTPLISVDWGPLLGLRVDQARAALKVVPYASPYAAAQSEALR
jgi:ubiquinone biosynthesis protein Coq4